MILSVELEELAPEDKLSLEAAKHAEDFFGGFLWAGPLQSRPTNQLEVGAHKL